MRTKKEKKIEPNTEYDQILQTHLASVHKLCHLSMIGISPGGTQTFEK